MEVTTGDTGRRVDDGCAVPASAAAPGPADDAAAPGPVTSRRADPVLVGWAGVVLVAAGVLAPGLPGDTGQAFVCWVLMTVVHVAAALVATRVSRAAGASDAVRRVWRGVAIGAACFVAGDLVQLVELCVGGATRATTLGGPVQALSALVGSVVIVGVVLAEPLRIAVRADRRRFWLDVWLVVVAAVAVSAAVAPGRADLSAAGVVLSTLLGSGVFLVGVFAVAKVAFAPQRPLSRGAGAVLGSAAAGEAVLQAVGTPLVEAGRTSWLLALHLVANSLIVVAARLQERSAAAPGPAAGRRGLGLLPQAAVVVTDGLLVTVLATRPVDVRTWVVVAGAVASTAIVLARQTDAVRRAGTLLARLDARVAELDGALRERDELAERLHRLAFHDALTGLANRARLVDHLGGHLGGHLAGSGSRLALLVVDLDDFKPVNDAHGHAAGNRVLRVVAERLQAAAGPGAAVARLGGDEFAVVVHDPAADLAALAARVVAEVSRPVDVPGGTALVTASAGAVEVTRRDVDVEDVLHAADLAMYAAKRAGKNRTSLGRL